MMCMVLEKTVPVPMARGRILHFSDHIAMKIMYN
jgi:hypothetical protein